MDKLEKTILQLSEQLKDKLLGSTISLAESCTGGLLSAYITEIPGASEYFLAGCVAYDNQAKIDLLDVSPSTIEQFGAVSWQVAKEMALGIKAITESDIALAITGIAGPTGATHDKPLGTVCFAIAYGGQCYTNTVKFDGDRHQVRQLAVLEALRMIHSL